MPRAHEAQRAPVGWCCVSAAWLRGRFHSLAAQTAAARIVYVDHAFERRLRAGMVRNRQDIIHAHTEGTVHRARPKLKTVGTMLVGLTLLPWATGSKADVMKRIAAPMTGGLLSSACLTLGLIPVVHASWRRAQGLLARRTGRPLAEVCGLRDCPAAGGQGVSPSTRGAFRPQERHTKSRARCLVLASGRAPRAVGVEISVVVQPDLLLLSEKESP